MNLIKRILDSNLFKSAFVYGISSAINGALPFLLLPILTRFLSPEDYGLVTVFTTLISFYNVFIGLNVNGAVFNKFFFLKNNPNHNFSDYISNVVLLLISTTLLVLILTFLFLPQIISFTQLPPSWIFIAASTSFFQYLILIRLAVYQAAQKPKNYGLLLCAQSVINIALSLLFVISMNLGWQGRAWAICSALYIIGLYSLYKIIKEYGFYFKPSFKYLSEILKFGIPLVPHTLGAILISLADRFIITKLMSVADAGLYQAGIQISMGILFLTDAFNKAYSPWLYSSLQQKSEGLNLKIVKFTYLYFIVIFSIATVLAILPEGFFIWILGEKFKNAKDYITWSGYAYAFNGMYLMVCNYIFYSEKTKYLAYVTLPLGLLNIVLSYYLTLKVGVIGASISMCISYMLMFLLTWYVSAKLVKMPWKLKTFEQKGSK